MGVLTADEPSDLDDPVLVLDHRDVPPLRGLLRAQRGAGGGIIEPRSLARGPHLKNKNGDARMRRRVFKEWELAKAVLVCPPGTQSQGTSSYKTTRVAC